VRHVFDCSLGYAFHVSFTSHAEPVRSNHGIEAGASGRFGYIALDCMQPPPARLTNICTHHLAFRIPLQLIPQKSQQHPIMAKYPTHHIRISTIREAERSPRIITVNNTHPNTLLGQHRMTFCQPDIQQTAQATRSPQDSPPTAASIIFSTTELLEQVLSHLGVQDLIVLRRVSCHWRDVINSSLILQRALFLAPEPELDFEWHLKARCPNPLCRGKPHRYGRKPRGTVPDRGDTTMKSARFNSLMFERRLANEWKGDQNAPQSERLFPRSCFINAGANELFARMLISQPPVTHARVGCRTRLVNGKGIKVKDVRQEMQRQHDAAVSPSYEDPSNQDAETTPGAVVRHFASFVVEHAMFTGIDENTRQERHPAHSMQYQRQRCSAESETEVKLEQIIRYKGIHRGHCTDTFREEILVVSLD
jgi:hypothetical protein